MPHWSLHHRSLHLTAIVWRWVWLAAFALASCRGGHVVDQRAIGATPNATCAGPVAANGVPPTGELAFVSPQAGGDPDIFVLDLETGRARDVTRTLVLEWDPAWAPDGRTLAYMSANQLFLVQIDTARHTFLSRSSGPPEAFGPTWAPDGRQLAFHSDGALWRMPPRPTKRGATWQRITPAMGAITPDWSRVGDRIAFAAHVDHNTDIYTVRPDGSDLQRVTFHPAADSLPAWSADGTALAFVSDRDGNAEIYLMCADGRDVQRLTDDPAEDTWPTWEPSGRHMAFATRRAGNWDIYQMLADGRDPQPLVATPAEEETPAWRP